MAPKVKRSSRAAPRNAKEVKKPCIAAPRNSTKAMGEGAPSPKSPTMSVATQESEAERRERYPEIGSPRSSFKTCHERIIEAAPGWAREARVGSFARKRPYGAHATSIYGPNAFEIALKADHELKPPPMFPKGEGDDFRPQRKPPSRRPRKHKPRKPTPEPESDLGLFGRLPGELRNRIYREALVADEGKSWIVQSKIGTCSRGACIHAKLSTGVPGILTTCAQTRHEAMPIFCAENSFEFDAPTVVARCPANWIRALGKYAPLVDKMLLDVQVWESVTAPQNRTVMAMNTYKMVIERKLDVSCLPPVKRFSVEGDKAIARKEFTKCRELVKHMSTLESRLFGEGVGVVFEEFLRSDKLADLVYRCQKG